MSKSPNAESLFNQVFARIPPETASTFTPEQIEALKQGFSKLTWKQHTIDFRFSIPFPLRRFYLVILAGPERRSKQRLQAERLNHRIWTTGNIIAIAVFATLLIPSLFATIQILLPWSNPLPVSKFYPTAIPWLQDEAGCQRTDRTWRNGRCWDEEHSPFF